ncbi:MAG: beta-glucosidase, partial [Bacteroidales bacterium]|nr:beta-glucosidase [Bacteroidales bacterium]
MNKILMILGAVFCTIPMFAQPQLRKDNIDEVLKAMTLEEKAGLAVGASRPVNIGGIPTGSTMLVPGAAGVTRAIPRLGIPATVLADGPAGLRIDPVRPGSDATFYCTGFPVGTLLASSWDVDLVEKVTAAMGDEVLEYGVDVLLAPGMNIHRNPLCGRNF